MARRGRLSKEEKSKPIDPENQKIADNWIKVIGDKYNTIKDACRINALKQNKEWNEDIFQDSIYLCYNCICRNGLKDKSQQGMLNYLFSSYKTNLLHEKVIPYNSKRVDDESILQNYDEVDEEEGKTKFNEQLYTDYATIRLLEIAEKNVDSLSFYCFRLYRLMPHMSYRTLVKLTNIKNAKARVKAVTEYLIENVDKETLKKEFEEYLENKR